MPGRASAAASSWSPSPQRGGQHAAPRLLPRRAQEARSGSALVLVAIIPWARSTRRCYLRAAAPAWAGGGTRGAWGAQGRMGRAQWGSFALGKPPRSSSSRWPRGFTCGPGCRGVSLVGPGCRGWTGRKPHRENHLRENHLREYHLREYHHHFQGRPQRLAPPAALGGNRHPAGTDQPASA